MSVHLTEPLVGKPYPWGMLCPSVFLARTSVYETIEFDRRDELRAIMRDRIKSYRVKIERWDRQLEAIKLWKSVKRYSRREDSRIVVSTYPWGTSRTADVQLAMIKRAQKDAEKGLRRAWAAYRKGTSSFYRRRSVAAFGREFLRERGYAFELANSEYSDNLAKLTELGIESLSERAVVVSVHDVAIKARDAFNQYRRTKAKSGLLAGSSLKYRWSYDAMARIMTPGELDLMTDYNQTMVRNLTDKKYEFSSAWFDMNRDLLGAFYAHGQTDSVDLVNRYPMFSQSYISDARIQYNLPNNSVLDKPLFENIVVTDQEFDPRSRKLELNEPHRSEMFAVDLDNFPDRGNSYIRAMRYMWGKYSFMITGPAGSGKSQGILVMASNQQVAKRSFRIYSGTENSLQSLLKRSAARKMNLQIGQGYLYWSPDGEIPEKDYVCFVDEAGLAKINDVFENPSVQLIACGDPEQITIKDNLISWMVNRNFGSWMLRDVYRASDPSALAWSNVFVYDMNAIPVIYSDQIALEGRYCPLSVSKRNRLGNYSPDEAIYVAELALKALSSGKSVGVICFNRAQQKAVLDEMGDNKPTFIGLPVEVQSLEFDEVIVSMTLARNRFKRIPNYIKTLNGSHANRVMNTVVTRSRNKTIAVFSLLQDEINWITMTETQLVYLSMLKVTDSLKRVVPRIKK